MNARAQAIQRYLLVRYNSAMELVRQKWERADVLRAYAEGYWQGVQDAATLAPENLPTSSPIGKKALH